MTVHHIPGIKNEMADYISRNNFDALLGESSEALAKEAFQRMDVQLDLSMRTAGVLEGWSLRDYQAEYQCVFSTLSDGLEACLIDGDRWYKDNQYLYYEDRIVVPEARLNGSLQGAHHSSGHTGCNRSAAFFSERFYCRLTQSELRARMQSIVDSCDCHAGKQSDSRDRGLVSSLPIRYCANSLLYADFIHGLPKFGGYDSCLVVTCGLTHFTRAFPCSKKITGEQTVKILVEEWFEPYGAPKEIHSDEDVHIRSDTGWYKRVLDTLNVQVTTGVPYTHTSNPLCERQNRVREQHLRILMKQERTKGWVRLVLWAVLAMNSQESSSTGYTPHELFHGGRPAWFFKTPFPEDYKSSVGDWLEHRQDLANRARANPKRVRERELTRRNRTRRPASLKVGDLVLVNHSRLPTVKKVPTRTGPCCTPSTLFCVTLMVLLLTRVCMILPYPAQFPTKIVKYRSFTQMLIPCNSQLPSTIAQIQIIHTEGFQGCLRSRVDTQQLLSTRRSSHSAHGDTGVGHVHRIAPIK